MIKKIGGLVALISGLIVGIVPFVSAQFGSFDTKSIVESVIQFYESFFGPIFASLFGQYYSNEFLFAKILLFILLIIIISFILQKSKIFGDRKGLGYLVSVIVSLLALRYLPENDLINGILLPYGVLGVALMTFLPFLIYFFFVNQSVPGGFGRRAAWALYGVVFLVLLSFRWGELSSASQWIYIIGVILVILAFLFDKTIHEYFVLGELSKFKRGANTREIVSLQAEYVNIMNVESSQANQRRAAIERRLKELGAEYI